MQLSFSMLSKDMASTLKSRPKREIAKKRRKKKLDKTRSKLFSDWKIKKRKKWRTEREKMSS